MSIQPIRPRSDLEEAKSLFNRLSPSDQKNMSVERVMLFLAAYKTLLAEDEDKRIAEEKAVKRRRTEEHENGLSKFEKKCQMVLWERALRRKLAKACEKPQSKEEKENKTEKIVTKKTDKSDKTDKTKPVNTLIPFESIPPGNLVKIATNQPTEVPELHRYCFPCKSTEEALMAIVLFRTNISLECLSPNMDVKQETAMTAQEREHFGMKNVHVPLSGKNLAKAIRSICELEDRFHREVFHTRPDDQNTWPISKVWNGFIRVCHVDIVVVGNWMTRRTKMIQMLYGDDLDAYAGTARLSLKAKHFPTMSLFLRVWCMLWALTENKLNIVSLLGKLEECVPSGADFLYYLGEAFNSCNWVSHLDRSMKEKWCPELPKKRNRRRRRRQ
ncbi:hypothetical protein CKK34_0457 [Yarrowia sp. E02]|nr:hypothetical protein CKK34_0457 [Yarrowia sp. E02]